MASRDAPLEPAKRDLRRIRTSWVRRLLPWVVLTLAAALATAIAVVTRVPSLSANALTTALGQLVEVDRIDIRLGLMLEVEVNGLRVHSGLDPADPIVISAPRALGRQAWPRVLAGQIAPLDWVIEQPLVRTKISADAGDSGFDPGWVERFPLVGLVVHEGRLELEAAHDDVYVCDGVELELRRRTLLSGLAGSISGRVLRGERSLAGFDASVEASGDEISARTQLRNAPLPDLVELLGARDAFQTIAGSLSGSTDVTWREGRLDVSVDLSVAGFAVRVEGMRDTAAPTDTRLAATATIQPDSVRVKTQRLVLDDLIGSGELTVDRRGEGRVTTSLTVSPFALGNPKRLNLVTLLALRSPTFAQLARQTERGRLEDIRFELDLPVPDLDQLARPTRPLDPEALRVQATLVAGTLRARPDYTALENVSGTFVLHGDRFSISRLRMSREGSSIPTIDFVLDGYAHFVNLDPNERGIPNGPGVVLGGLGPAFTALGGSDRDADSARRASDVASAQPSATDAPTREAQLHVRNLTLEYPALVFPMRAVNGRFRFPPQRVIVDETTGIVAGGRAAIDVDWRLDQNALAIRLTYRPQDGPVSPDTTPRDVWIDGDFAMDATRIGGWDVSGLRGHVRASDAVLRVERVGAKMAGGSLRADGLVDLEPDGHAAIAFDVALTGADAQDTVRGMLPENETVSGRAKVNGKIRGKLDPGAAFLAAAGVDVEIELTEGELSQLPAAIKVARLPSLQGVRGLFGRPLPYTSITGRIGIDSGTLTARDFALLGPELRILLDGTVDLIAEERTTDIVVVLLFLRTLDGVIEQVPLLGPLILGKKGNLVSQAFEITGPFEDPSVTPLAPSAIRTALRGTSDVLRYLGSWIPGFGSGPEEPQPGSEPPQREPLERGPSQLQPSQLQPSRGAKGGDGGASIATPPAPDERARRTQPPTDTPRPTAAEPSPPGAR